MSLLANAADWFKSRKTPLDRWFEDERGRYAFAVTVDDQPFVVCARSYLNDGKASFMAIKIVQRAIDRDAYILLFTDGDRRLVFDPITVFEDGETDDVAEQDRERRGEGWVAVDAARSVPFDAWIDRGIEPPKPGAEA